MFAGSSNPSSSASFFETDSSRRAPSAGTESVSAGVPQHVEHCALQSLKLEPEQSELLLEVGIERFSEAAGFLACGFESHFPLVLPFGVLGREGALPLDEILPLSSDIGLLALQFRQVLTPDTPRFAFQLTHGIDRLVDRGAAKRRSVETRRARRIVEKGGIEGAHPFGGRGEECPGIGSEFLLESPLRRVHLFAKRGQVSADAALDDLDPGLDIGAPRLHERDDVALLRTERFGAQAQRRLALVSLLLECFVLGLEPGATLQELESDAGRPLAMLFERFPVLGDLVPQRGEFVLLHAIVARGPNPFVVDLDAPIQFSLNTVVIVLEGRVLFRQWSEVVFGTLESFDFRMQPCTERVLFPS